MPIDKNETRHSHDLRSFLNNLLHPRTISSCSCGNGTHSQKDFEIIKNLGKGGSSSVCLARDKATNQLVALKIFKAKDGDVPSKIHQVQNEYNVTSSLHHPNIVKVKDLIHDNKRYLEVIEYCPHTLFDLISAETLLKNDQICFFKELLSGLAFVHQSGFAHRDVKPENLLVDETKHLKIADFGAACFTKPTQDIVGSEPYMAPEEIEGSRRDYDPIKVDVWASAIVYLVMVYNSMPWKRASKTDIRFANFLAKGDTPGLMIQRLNPLEKSVIRKALELDFNKRPNVTELLSMPLFDNAICG